MSTHGLRMGAAACACAVALAAGVVGLAQSAPASSYRWDREWVPKLPDGRQWGSTAGVGVDKAGNIYIA